MFKLKERGKYLEIFETAMFPMKLEDYIISILRGKTKSNWHISKPLVKSVWICIYFLH